MTVYTDDTLANWYIDQDGTTDFVDSNGETVIIAEGGGVPPPADRIFTIHFV